MKRECYNALFDKAALLFFVVFLFWNVLYKAVENVLGGIGILSIIYAMLFYFAVLYGRRGNETVKIRWFLLFIVIYVIEIQLFSDGGSIYESFGGEFKTAVWNMVSFVPIAVSAVMILQYSDGERKKWFENCLLICLAVSFAVTIFILQFAPDAVRVTAVGGAKYYPFLADYGVIYGAVILMPYLFVHQKGKRPIIRYMLIALFAICIFCSAYTIAIVAVVLGIVCFFFLKLRSKVTRVAVAVCAVFLTTLICLSGAYETVLRGLSDAVPISEVSERLSQLADLVALGEVGDAVSRISLYASSVRAFLSHPLTGSVLWNSDAAVSGHSANLDILGLCGAVVFAVYFKFVYEIYRYNRVHSHGAEMRAAAGASLLCFMFISTLNPIFAAPEIFVLFVLGAFASGGSGENREM